MTHLSFAIDSRALIILGLGILCGYILWLRWKRAPQPILKFSSLIGFASRKNSWKVSFVDLPERLSALALILFALAFIDPRFYLQKSTGPLSTTPSEGIAMYLVIDQSGSMAESIKITASDGTPITTPKIDLMKNITTKFVEGDIPAGLQGRMNDLIGLITFARTAHLIVPLTLDHKAIADEIKKISVVKNLNEDGTAIGYAIYKAANIISATRHYAEDLQGADQPAYNIKSAVIILVTDGFHSPNPSDADNSLRNINPLEAAEYAKNKKIKLYIINIEPALSSEQFGAHRRLMQKATQLTGGKFYLMDSSTSLNQIYSDIDKLEKSILPEEKAPVHILSKDEQPDKYQRISIYPYFIALGLIAILISIFLEASFIRKVP